MDKDFASRLGRAIHILIEYSLYAALAAPILFFWIFT
jgi:hypothetical protein